MKKHFILPLMFAAGALAGEQENSQWNVDMAYGCWADKHRGINQALLHVQGTQRLLPAAWGTWLRVELSGSWGLDSRSVSHADDVFAHGYATGVHADYFGPHRLYLPEVALMQRFAGNRACLVAGMVNLTNDLDAVGIANDSFATFAHNAFTNSTVLPLPDSNAAAVLRVEITEHDYAVVAVSRTGAMPGSNPFASGPPGCCVVGEYGHVFQECGITLRLNPFCNHHDAGVAASVEYGVNNCTTLFARTGCSSAGVADFSCGATFKLIPSREDDFLGIAYALLKADSSAAEESYNNREHVLELVYSFQLAEHIKLMPHIQYTHHPAYDACCKNPVLIGIQTVVSF